MNHISDKSFDNVLLDPVESGIFRLTINRPKSLNALNKDTLVEMNLALDIVSQDLDAHVLMITGAGDKAFVAGADIKYMSNLSPLQGKAFSQLGTGILQRLESMSIPVIALVNGYALGGGCELAMSCDFILASDNASFAQPEIKLGITPGFGGSQRLTRMVGRAMAMELLVTGRHMSAKEAFQRCLVNHVYPQSELAQQGMSMAQTIASGSRTAIHLSKQLVQRGQDMDLDKACAMESDIFGLSFSSEDRQEGMAAFVNNRHPKFS